MFSYGNDVYYMRQVMTQNGLFLEKEYAAMRVPRSASNKEQAKELAVELQRFATPEQCDNFTRLITSGIYAVAYKVWYDLTYDEKTIKRIVTNLDAEFRKHEHNNQVAGGVTGQENQSLGQKIPAQKSNLISI